METEEEQRVIPFQLQFDKPVASQVCFYILAILSPIYMSGMDNFVFSIGRLELRSGIPKRIYWLWSPRTLRFCCTASIGRGCGQSRQVSFALSPDLYYAGLVCFDCVIVSLASFFLLQFLYRKEHNIFMLAT